MPVSAVGGAKERIMADDRLWEQVRSQEEALNGEGRILVRPSGTEALIRVMVEAKTVEIAHNVAKTLAEFHKNPVTFCIVLTKFYRLLDKQFIEKV